MHAHNTVTYQRWADLVLTPARAPRGAASARTEPTYELDLSAGSYAVRARAFAAQLTPERWYDALRMGMPASGAAVELFENPMEEPALVGAW